MMKQVRAEVKKLLSTRTLMWLSAGAVAIALLSVWSVGGQTAAEYAKPLNEQQFFFVATYTKILIVVLGIRIITDEYRFGTAVPTFAFTPRRERVIGAKVVVAAIAGLAVAALVQATILGSATLMFSLNDHVLVLGSEGPRAIVGAILAGALWSVVGVGVGAILRSQVAAVVGSLVWLMAIEEMLRGFLGDAASVLPGHSGYGLALATDTRAMVLGGLGLVAWAALLSAGGWLSVRRADVV